MKKLLLLLLLFNCYCGKTDPEQFFFDSLENEFIHYPKQVKKCEAMQSLLVASADPKDEALMFTLLTYDCYKAVYGYPKSTYSSSSQNKNTSEN